MLSITVNVRTNSSATFSYELLHTDIPVLTDQQKTFLPQLYADTGCNIEDLLKRQWPTGADREREKVSKECVLGTPSG